MRSFRLERPLDPCCPGALLRPTCRLTSHSGFGQEKAAQRRRRFPAAQPASFDVVPGRALHCVNGQRGKNYPQHQTYHSVSQTSFPLLRPRPSASSRRAPPSAEPGTKQHFNSRHSIRPAKFQPHVARHRPPLSNLPALVTGWRLGCDSAREVSDRLPRHTTRPRPDIFSPLPEPQR